jgi:hypothetical protein
MPLIDDASVSDEAILLRVLLPNWICEQNGVRRVTKQAFLDGETGEASCFIDGAGVQDEVRRIFPGKEVAAIPARVVRECGFVIERRPDEADPFTGDPNAHVVLGTAVQVRRLEYERCAKRIALHIDTRILPEGNP